MNSEPPRTLSTQRLGRADTSRPDGDTMRVCCTNGASLSVVEWPINDVNDLLVFWHQSLRRRAMLAADRCEVGSFGLGL